MKPRAVTLILVATVFLLAGGCSSPGGTGVATEDKPLPGNYPYSEVETVYDVVLDGMTSKYFAEFPDLDREHTAKMREFIRESFPREKFVDEMVRDKERSIFERAQIEPEFRQTKEFEDAFELVVGVSVPMARMIIGGQRDIYVAKFVDKDPVRIELLEMAKTLDEQQFASWAYSEVPVEDARKECGDELKTMPGDKVFGFSSPPETWENLCGRAGFLVVRDGAIVQTIVTMMN